MFEFSIHINSICPAGKQVYDLVREGNSDGLKLIIGDTVIGKKGVYIDEVNPDNLVGIISKPFWEDNPETDELNEWYSLRIVSTKGSSHLNMEAEKKDINLIPEWSRAEEIEKKVEEIVKSGLCTAQELDKRVQYMKDNRVDEPLILRVLEGYRAYNRNAHVPSTIYVDPFLSSTKKAKRQSIIQKGIRSACDRHAIICEGDKSVGKNVYLETIAWLMNMPLYLITFNRQMSPSAIYGEKTTDNSALEALDAFDSKSLAHAEITKSVRKVHLINKVISVIASSFLKKTCPDKVKDEEYSEKVMNVFYEEAEFQKLKASAAAPHIKMDQSEMYDWLSDGGLLVFNEMNLADANFFASFSNQLLDGTGFLNMPGRGDVRINPDCVLFGTQNVDYVGLEMQNEATISRFGTFKFRQPTTIKEQVRAATSSALRRIGLDPDKLITEDELNQIDLFYKQIMDAAKKGTISSTAINIRGYVRALTETCESSGYASLNEQLETHVCNSCDNEEIDAVLSILNTCVTV